MNLDNFSPLTQILLVFGGLALLFLLVLANNKRNKEKRSGSNSKNFRQRIKDRREEQHKK